MKNEEIKIIPIIPSLNPDNKTIKYVEDLIKLGFKKIIVVNDGSSSEYDRYFESLSKNKECVILKHNINYGKGKALKTAFKYYLDNFNDYTGIVTVDSDGQHSLDDTLRIAKELKKNNDCLILGTRDFNKRNVPFKSKYGNKITTFVFKLLYGKKINDTQTGLRGISNDLISKIVNIPGDRFEYEINMLIFAVKNKINIIEIPIKTIYKNKNNGSHFKPFKDAIKIYKCILKSR